MKRINNNSADITERGTPRKEDITHNADQDRIEKSIREQRVRDVEKHPLRLNSATIIYVDEKNCNAEYADKSRLKLGIECRDGKR
ncbi:hypothetical protein [uncultured Bacteroides sp.]|uniref:hypothetical protein n=1 Tax=uncultured Bacteroides sp. TaxID=162156 RepID=UPI002AA829A8|nr:hypothetical protein [uncultured Bacteroides sp.]